MRRTAAILAGILCLFSLPILLALPAGADTLGSIKSRGYLQCGVSQGQPGFSSPDNKGNWTGIDVEFCKAVAAAIFGSVTKVRFTPLSAKERFTALQTGEVDILARNTTWTLIRDTALGLNFIGVLYYDGQGFMIRKELGVKSAKELSGATICANAGTTTELNVTDYFRANKLQFDLVTFEKSDEVVRAYQGGRCDAYTGDRSGLFGQRLKLTEPAAHVILPEIISKEPLGPAVRQGDAVFEDIARWTLFALINAEELGVTRKNIAAMKASPHPDIRRLVGVEGEMGAKLHLRDSWAYDVIVGVGNYAEIFERTVGRASPLGIERGLNALPRDGGILYAPPIR
jgi:general L-amino acid transport system substrate-binding protein